MSKATEITICVFTGTSKNKVFSFNANNEIVGVFEDQLTENERSALYAAQNARDKLNAPVPVNVYICPYDYDTNVVTIEQNKFGQNLPAVLMTAYYPENIKRQYPIANLPFGVRQWNQDELYNYMKSLYTGEFGSGQSIICKLLPPLCNVGAYLWLAATGVAVYKTVEQKNNPALQTVWGAASILCLEAFVKGGGFEKIFKKK